MPDYSPYQRKIIDRYYDKRDEIMLAKLGEIVSELYLAESEAKLSRLWTRVAKAMEGLRVPQSIAEHILKERKPEILAKNLRGWLDGVKRPHAGGGHS